MSIYDLSATTLDGAVQSFDAYRGKTLLIVNVASQCGFTPQYQGLEALWRTFKDRGLVVLGFPCNQFGRQEPGDAAAIKQFCLDQYEISFPLFAKIAVNGVDAHPLYQHLKAAAPGVLGSEAIKWNFTKFLIDANGHVTKRYGSVDTPEKIEQDIAALLPPLT
ncbi:MAG: glutathione peroxidase [Gammaproteobacteria bacterium]|nr:glutathione peroxidase [Gammaproteobacteria bacterium]